MSQRAGCNSRPTVFTCSVRLFQFFFEIITFDFSIKMGFKFQMLSGKESF
jgi:hypothetical protein